MRFFTVSLAALMLAFACGSCTYRPLDADPGPLVILVGLDGFRWDAMDRGTTPNMDRLAAGGFKGAMTPVFPTLSFPNLYAVVTGLHPENSGILANEMYDPEFDAYFSSRVFDEARWWGGEPIWVTVEKQGGVAATTGWIASSAPIKGVRPTHYIPYVEEKPPEERVEDLLRLLDDSEHRPIFLTLYHDDVDNYAHDFGVGSKEEKVAIERMDAMIGQFITGLEQRGLFEEATIVIVADHGMANLEPNPAIYLDDFISIEAVRKETLGLGPLANIWPLEESDADGLYYSLSDAHPHLTVYKREDIPERYRFGNHRRTPPIFAIADEGWIVTTREANSLQRLQTKAGQASRETLGGMHGYSNELRSMHPILIAHGPAIRAGAPAQTIDIVDVYQLLTHALGLSPAQNDGNWLHICPILFSPPTECI